MHDPIRILVRIEGVRGSNPLSSTEFLQVRRPVRVSGSQLRSLAAAAAGGDRADPAEGSDRAGRAWCVEEDGGDAFDPDAAEGAQLPDPGGSACRGAGSGPAERVRFGGHAARAGGAAVAVADAGSGRRRPGPRARRRAGPGRLRRVRVRSGQRGCGSPIAPARPRWRRPGAASPAGRLDPRAPSESGARHFPSVAVRTTCAIWEWTCNCMSPSREVCCIPGAFESSTLKLRVILSKM